MDYKAAFESAVQQVRSEGRYRVFADLKRHRGAFPRATWTREDGSETEIVVWCSNDYLGQGQNPVVIEAMHEAIDATGKGYLMAAVSLAGQTTPAAVCSDGFNQIAALAACRSVGYTPGPNASFTVATSTSIHAINNVTCPSTAKNLTECKLQYSGTGYKISYAARQVCAGRVYLDCDLGTPSVQFRMDSSRYLQARLYADSEWGWVDVGYGVPSQEGHNALCSHSTSDTGDSSITKSFLSVSYCPSSATSYTDCTYEYTDGVPGTSDYYCSSDNAPSSPSRSRSSSRSSTGFGTGGIVGVAVGVPIGIIFLVCLCIFLKKKKTPPPGVNNGIEMTTTNNQLLSVPSNPAVYNFASQSGAGGAAPASGGGIYGSSVASPATTNNWNNAYNSGNIYYFTAPTYKFQITEKGSGKVLPYKP